MKTGDIVLIPFPFAEQYHRKVRPAAVVCLTADKYRDVVLCAISSVIPINLNKNEHLLKVDGTNGLRKESVLKVDRIVTAKSEDIIATLGQMSETDKSHFKNIFSDLIKNTDLSKIKLKS